MSALQCFYIRQFFSFPFRTLFIGSVGSIFLSEFGWHSVFIFHGLMALLWAYLWRFYLQLPQQKQKRQQFALGNIKMVETCGYERAALMNVPWKLFARHSAVWLVFFGLSQTVIILSAFLEVKIVSILVHTLSFSFYNQVSMLVLYCGYVLAQFYPWFKFHLPLFMSMVMCVNLINI